MIRYHVPALPLKAQILRAMGEACLPIAIEFALRPHQMTLVDLVGQGIICGWLLFFFQQEEPFDLEIDASGIRKIKNGQVGRSVSSERIRYAKESGRGSFRSLTVSEHTLARLGRGSIVIPTRASGYEEIKAQVLAWQETRRTSRVLSVKNSLQSR